MERRAGHRAHFRSSTTQGSSDTRPSPQPEAYPSRGHESYKGSVSQSTPDPSPASLTEPVIGPRFARTRWLARHPLPQGERGRKKSPADHTDDRVPVHERLRRAEAHPVFVVHIGGAEYQRR